MGLRNDRASSVLQTVDGGYILAGSTGSSGSEDIWMIKIANTESTTSQISDFNETVIPLKTTPGFEFVGVLISITLLFFLQRKFIKMIKKG